MKPTARARFIATTFLLATALGAAAAATRPNVILILADDLGYADTGFGGSPDIATPHLDRFAREGAILDCLYGQPVCSPTRAALLTGRYPVRTGVYNVVQYAALPQPLPLAERTLAETLRAAGYTTALVGKWHLGDHAPEYLPTRRGFDRQYGFMGGGIHSFTHLPGGERDPAKTDWHRQDRKQDEPGYSTELLADEACRLIRAQPADRPLFLFVAPNAVHTPWVAPEEHLRRYAHLPERRRQLAAMTSALDDAFGRIMAALHEQRLGKNTLVIFSSDNGGTSWDRVSSNGPLRGGKSDIYEGGLRLAAFAWWPGRIPAGTRIAAPLHVVDWYPTLARLAGASLAQALALDGRDIWPALARGAPSPHDEILLMGSRPGQRALRAGDWKLLVNPGEFRGAAGSASVELYHLATDLGERNNRAAAEPARVADLQARLARYLADSANAAFHALHEKAP
jgi:arylsulfatase A-like enzyme